MTDSQTTSKPADRTAAGGRVQALVGRFQCPGCVCGSDTECGEYYYDENELRCISHVLGTSIGPPGNRIALGLPKGFQRPGFADDDRTKKNKMHIRLYLEGDKPAWDNLNVPVWAMAEDGFLFVRTFAPRIDVSWVDVIEGGDLDMVPGAINVADFLDEID